MVTADAYNYFRNRRRRRRRIAISIIAIVLIGAGAAEMFISSIIAARVRETIAERLDARLELGVLLYVPPYGAWVSSARLVREGKTIFRISPMRMRLANVPWKGKPLLFAAISGDEPVLSLRPGEFKNLVKHPLGAQPAKKISDILRLDSLRFSDGRIVWHDASASSKPAIWDSLQIDIDTARQSVSKYTFRLVSRARPVADATASGTFDVDSLQLELQSLSMNVNAGPAQSASPLPAAVQEILNRFSMTGVASLDAAGRINLHDPAQAQMHGRLLLRDGMARFVRPVLEVTRATAEADFTKSAGGPIEVSLRRLDLAAPGKLLRAEGGKIQIDAIAGRWSLAELQGHIEMSRLPAGAPVISKLDRYDPAGHADFTASAAGPLRLDGADPLRAIDHEVEIYPQEASFRPKDFAGRIEKIGGSEIRIHAGVIVCQELYGIYGSDELRLHSARLPIAGLPKFAQWKEISGVATFHPPLKKYSPKLDVILDALHPSGPFIIAGSYTVDHRTAASRNTYDLMVSSDIGSLSPTRLKIPFHQIRGDATVTPDGVDLQDANAELFDGRAAINGRWRHDEKHQHAEGELQLDGIELAQCQQWLKSAAHSRSGGDPPAASSPAQTMMPMTGKIFAQAQFSGSIPKTTAEPLLAKLRDARANGELEIVDGDLFKLPVISDLVAAVAPIKDAATIGSAATVFDLADGQIQLHDAAVSAPMLGFDGGGRIGLDGSLDLSVVAAPLADWRDKLLAMKIPIVSDVTGAVAGQIQKLLNTATGTLLYQFVIKGNLHQPTLTPVPAPILTNAAASIFGQMLAPQKNQQPLDWFKQGQ